WQDKIYFIDFGMVGEVGPDLRELLILMLIAFWQEDVSFLSDVVLMITGSDQNPDLDVGAFQAELGELLARYRHLSLKEIQLGPILQEITEIPIRHDVPLPASLALVAGGVWIATATTAASTHVSGWVPRSLASLGGVLTLGLGIDGLRRRRN